MFFDNPFENFNQPLGVFYFFQSSEKQKYFFMVTKFQLDVMRFMRSIQSIFIGTGFRVSLLGIHTELDDTVFYPLTYHLNFVSRERIFSFAKEKYPIRSFKFCL